MPGGSIERSLGTMETKLDFCQLARLRGEGRRWEVCFEPISEEAETPQQEVFLCNRSAHMYTVCICALSPRDWKRKFAHSHFQQSHKACVGENLVYRFKSVSHDILFQSFHYGDNRTSTPPPPLTAD